MVGREATSTSNSARLHHTVAGGHISTKPAGSWVLVPAKRAEPAGFVTNAAVCRVMVGSRPDSTPPRRLSRGFVSGCRATRAPNQPSGSATYDTAAGGSICQGQITLGFQPVIPTHDQDPDRGVLVPQHLPGTPFPAGRRLTPVPGRSILLLAMNKYSALTADARFRELLGSGAWIRR